jgi:hypothetical protein
MTNIIKMGIAGIASVALFAGCGESYQALYSGVGKVTQDSCGGVPATSYSIQIQFSSSSPDLSMTVTKFQPETASLPDTMYNYIAGIPISAKYAGGESQFSVLGQTYSNTTDTVSAFGALSPDKQTISSFSFTRNSTVPGTNTACVFSVSASNLIKK